MYPVREVIPLEATMTYHSKVAKGSILSVRKVSRIDHDNGLPKA